MNEQIPLGVEVEKRPEIGPSAIRYYEAKHRRGEFGRFYPLHVVLSVNRKINAIRGTPDGSANTY